ncbi:endoribonuclease YbeY [bacterium BMS3Abin01]|nr:endoribonuclease YbeY [bacterium BMS3Abin01]HDZ59264.1 rRNA maturation RNase YbeY [Actinomycetota bacterium]
MTDGVEIQVENRSSLEVQPETVISLAEKVLGQLGVDRGELGVTFVDDREMRKLNREKMGKDRPTDVLAFPIDTGAGRTGDGEVPLLLGDIVISPEVAEAQAESEGTTFKEEMCLLLIHGILHIAGSDHEKDSGEMDQLQNRLFNQLCF